MKKIVDMERLAKEILDFTRGKSVFVYGSRSRNNFSDKSDYEIGVLVSRDDHVRRAAIKEKFNLPDVSIFPFVYEDFIVGNPDTPFVRSFFLNDVIRAGKTLAGERIVEGLTPPDIEVIDVLQEIKFNLGCAFTATHSYRNGDNETAALHLAKSCLFGTRNYILIKNKNFLTSYDEILRASKEFDLGEYEDLPEYAYDLRLDKVELDDKNLFRNISYLNKLIEPEIRNLYNTSGNIQLV